MLIGFPQEHRSFSQESARPMEIPPFGVVNILISPDESADKIGNFSSLSPV
jgi:hypothetical protein